MLMNVPLDKSALYTSTHVLSWVDQHTMYANYLLFEPWNI